MSVKVSVHQRCLTNFLAFLQHWCSTHVLHTTCDIDHVNLKHKCKVGNPNLKASIVKAIMYHLNLSKAYAVTLSVKVTVFATTIAKCSHG